jgi:hypothetical protein
MKWGFDDDEFVNFDGNFRSAAKARKLEMQSQSGKKKWGIKASMLFMSYIFHYQSTNLLVYKYVLS